LVGGSLLLGCPQLLDDDFGKRLGPDASVPGGSGGAGAGGSGGSAGMPGPARPGPAPPPGGGRELRELLAHRYRFDGPGNTVVDSVGDADGVTVGAVLGAGRVTLTGLNYVDLPNALLAGLESVTLEAWVTWSVNPASPGSDWQVLFSFGTNVNGEGSQGSGTTYLALTPKATDSGAIRASYTLTGYDDEVYADAADDLPTTAGTQVVMVVDGQHGSLTVYVDGAVAGTQTGLSIDLSAIQDVNNWIGRSQFTQDPNFVGEVLDFRIYPSALSASQVALSHTLGADAPL
jgi:hypothetical protein